MCRYAHEKQPISLTVVFTFLILIVAQVFVFLEGFSANPLTRVIKQVIVSDDTDYCETLEFNLPNSFSNSIKIPNEEFESEIGDFEPSKVYVEGNNLDGPNTVKCSSSSDGLNPALTVKNADFSINDGSFSVRSNSELDISGIVTATIKADMTINVRGKAAQSYSVNIHSCKLDLESADREESPSFPTSLKRTFCHIFNLVWIRDWRNFAIIVFLILITAISVKILTGLSLEN